MRNDHNRQFAVAEFKGRNEKRGNFTEYTPEKHHYRMDEAFFQSFICTDPCHTFLHNIYDTSVYHQKTIMSNINIC